MQNFPPLSLGIISLGCVKNRVDSEILSAYALQAGFPLALSPEKADIVLINTCAFIHDARQESIDTILEVCQWKSLGRCKAIVVSGCLPQRYQTDLTCEFPEVDAFIGLDELPDIGLILRRLAEGEQGIRYISRFAHKMIEPPSARPLFTPGSYAYLKIAEGCGNRCHYCAIPLIRGRHRSRPLTAIVREAEEILSRGVKELNLISQDIMDYGSDLKDGTDLPMLLRALNNLGGDFWIRILYGHPARVTDKLLDTIGELPRVCRYLDLPIQHSHPDVLAAMGRPLPPEGLDKLFENIRRHLPNVTLRTTCLVGFPGETTRRYQHLLDFVTRTSFDHLAVFKFSPEEGTPAAKLKHRISHKTMEQREYKLMVQQHRRVTALSKTKIGQTDTFLIDSAAPRRPNVFIARSAACAPEVDGVTYLNGGQTALQIGSFVKARYFKARNYDMEAEL